jgi:hypothetical protein
MWKSRKLNCTRTYNTDPGSSPSFKGELGLKVGTFEPSDRERTCPGCSQTLSKPKKIMGASKKSLFCFELLKDVSDRFFHPSSIPHI